MSWEDLLFAIAKFIASPAFLVVVAVFDVPRCPHCGWVQ